jgi:hypothetical protein
VDTFADTEFLTRASSTIRTAPGEPAEAEGGWGSFFRYSTVLPAGQKLDRFVYDCVRMMFRVQLIVLLSITVLFDVMVQESGPVRDGFPCHRPSACTRRCGWR